MKKKSFILAVICLLFISDTVLGQSLKDILNSAAVKDAVSSVAGKKGLTAERLQGQWTFEKSACELKTENILKGAGGSVISSQMEKKIDDLCAKAGIKEGKFSYTFNADSTFTSELASGKPMNGTYTFNPETQTLTMNFGKLLKLTSLDAKVTQSGDNINLLFNADKLLSLISTISATSQNSTLKLANQIASQYDGMLLGFELKKL